jgi:hypothetical protein
MSVDGSLPSLVRQVYSPPLGHGEAFSLGDWLRLDAAAIRYFSLGRHAMVAALKVLGVGRGDLVGLPEFICRDLLASLAALGAAPAYYPVDGQLGLAGAPEQLLRAKALVAVNYFGFPQHLDPFREIAARSGATIIEDNAHGFLSRDASGVSLGARTPLGVFSLRKTLPVGDGGALAVNDPALVGRLPEALPFLAGRASAGQLYKGLLRRTVPVLGTAACRASTGATRALRRLRTGHAIPPPDPDGETAIGLPPEPHAALLPQLARIDCTAEVERRRALYILLLDQVRDAGGLPIFDSLPPGVSPYVLPFRASAEAAGRVAARLRQLGLECHRWPELPAAVAGIAKPHYLDVWMVPFLW